jgi:hypothetical protein
LRDTPLPVDALWRFARTHAHRVPAADSITSHAALVPRHVIYLHVVRTYGVPVGTLAADKIPV